MKEKVFDLKLNADFDYKDLMSITALINVLVQLCVSSIWLGTSSCHQRTYV